MKVIVIGASFGGMEALNFLISNLPKDYVIPIIVVLHIGNNSINTFLTQLEYKTEHRVVEAVEREMIEKKTIYFAPANYHLQVEDDLSFSLSTDEKVNFSRPSIDVLFETAAWAIRDRLIGILLTGSNDDGARGLQMIKKYGGVTIVEDPETAFAKNMPLSAIKLFNPHYILNLDSIAFFLRDIEDKEMM